MVQFGAGPKLAAQCPPRVPVPDGWRAWTDADGPVPDDLLTRSKALIDDLSVPLGTTESYPLPGVTTLVRVEPSLWGRANGTLVQGCFRATGLYLPAKAPLVPTVAKKEERISRTTKIIAGLTVVSLTVGIVATIVSLRKRKKT